MFEVVTRKTDGTTETWDCLTDHQAQYIFFKSRMNPTNVHVELNEWIDPINLTS